MIGYITLGTNNLEKPAKFYDTLLSAGFQATRQMEEDRFIVWGTEQAPNQFGIIRPFNNGAATISNGGMISLQLDSKAKVDHFYDKAIELGASDEGKPGPRQSDAFYASYFRDLDGNKNCAFFFDNSNM